jgi:TetR/AcrR family transcriptional regulator, transcriptional repressor for nem operon
MASTRELILDNAFELFYTNGYSATGISDILKACNLHKGSLYYLFKSKKELALAVIEERINRRFVNKFSIIETSEQPLHTLFEILRDRDDFDFNRGCALNNFVQELSNIDEDFKEVLENVYVNLQSYYEAALRLEKNPQEHKLKAQFLLSVVEGALVSSKVAQDKKPYFEVIDMLEKNV